MNTNLIRSSKFNLKSLAVLTIACFALLSGGYQSDTTSLPNTVSIIDTPLRDSQNQKSYNVASQDSYLTVAAQQLEDNVYAKLRDRVVTTLWMLGLVLKVSDIWFPRYNVYHLLMKAAHVRIPLVKMFQTLVVLFGATLQLGLL